MSVASPDELRIINDYILLPMIITMVERSRDDIKESGITLADLYVKTTNIIGSVIVRELTETKRTLRGLNIVVYSAVNVEDGAKYRYRVRGKEDHFELTREYVRTEIVKRIADYTAALFQKA
ncbi:hypothetical protein ACFPYJ_20980 [Paenibacillus solisilvae]|uniref:Uncharacterized protein n=1 Tax=Paenibacillus solisilvae TaxID=2486751 RepID=A0ABW0W263_9BACL